MELIDSETFKQLPKKFKRIPPERVIKMLIMNKISFYIRKGTDYTEILYEGKRRMYIPYGGKFNKRKIHLFGTVKKNVLLFIKNNPFIEMPPIVKTTEYNYTYDCNDGTITGTDLDHAFWRIAYVKGYITKKTYDSGLEESAKELRLATLSVLGSEKIFEQYIKGELVRSIDLVKSNPHLQEVYKDIRYSCYYMMHEIKELLGVDFFCYKTDAVFYRDTEENRSIVHSYFEQRELLFKQLVYNSLDSFIIVD